MAFVSPAGSLSLGNALAALGFVPPHPASIPAKKIKQAYKRAALACHPDKNPDDADAGAVFLTVKSAYDELLGAVGKPAQPRGARPSGAGYQAWQEQARSNSATMSAAFASFRPKTEQKDASKDPVTKHKRESAASRKPAAATGSTSRSKPKRAEISRSGGHRQSGCGGAPRTAPRARPWGVSPAWGAACGTCADCRAEAAVPSSTKKKRDKLNMFRDVAVEQRPSKRARHRPYTDR